MKAKEKWVLLLGLDSLLFLLALVTNILPLYFLVLFLAFFIYKNGNAVLFKEYDERKKRKRAEYQAMQTAVNETRQTNKQLKKKKEMY